MYNLKFKNKTFRYVGTYINRRPGADSILPQSHFDRRTRWRGHGCGQSQVRKSWAWYVDEWRRLRGWGNGNVGVGILLLLG